MAKSRLAGKKSAPVRAGNVHTTSAQLIASKGLPIANLSKAVEKVKYPGLDLRRLYD